MADETTRRTGGDTTQPHGKSGPPTDHNDNPQRSGKSGIHQEAENAHNPTNPAKMRPEDGAGAPGWKDR